MTQYLIRVELAPSGPVYYELRASPEARDACVAQILSTHPEMRVASSPLPDDAAPIFALTMEEATLQRDPGRGA